MCLVNANKIMNIYIYIYRGPLLIHNIKGNRLPVYNG